MEQNKDLFSPANDTVVPKAAAPRPAVKTTAKTGNGPRGASSTYSAADIEVLEGLEPVRRRPGMYIGGTDISALHHLFSEVIDNAMDEALAGHASRIEVELEADGHLTVTDNGRGIPVDPHPKFTDRSALEVIMTTLHAGGKFDSAAYETSGGLHGVGISVVNALSEITEVEVARDQRLYRQEFVRGLPTTPLVDLGRVHNRRGTRVRFRPDPQIFGANGIFQPSKVLAMTRAKAYLFGGVEIRWSCDEVLVAGTDVVSRATFHFPDGLKDYVIERVGNGARIVDDLFAGRTGTPGKNGALEWAVAFVPGDAFVSSYCNTIHTRDGGTHEAGLRTALLRGLKAYGELSGNKRGAAITADDVMTNSAAMLSIYVREPEFVGQTKDRLSSPEAARLVETGVRDAFDHWLAASPQQASRLLDWTIERAEERIARRKEKEIARKSATRKLRLPGKLTDCTQGAADGAELFLVEGDSAGGSAKQARFRASQAVLPLRGKVLNVAGASRDKVLANQQLADIVQAVGVGTRERYRASDLRYDKIIIMTDADVDGAHIASLLITFFYSEMPGLVDDGHLYLAMPPLFRISQGPKVHYARDDAHLAILLETEFTGRGKVDVTRFKGLGEMPFAHLKETTMNPKSRTLLQVMVLNDGEETRAAVDSLMGNRPEARFRFIQENARFATDLDI
ncbi:MAG: DNA topoisomerase IV subunit B [Alphaproteobacteria bacterium]|nr:DNA topoisomerase IV subunit B [Alphaproteobacteria bacterium]